MTITDRSLNATWAHDLSGRFTVWWSKVEKNDKVRHNMTQIARLQYIATAILSDLWTPFTVREGGGAYTSDKSTYAGT